MAISVHNGWEWNAGRVLGMKIVYQGKEHVKYNNTALSG